MELPALEVGDFVAFEMAGAYTNVFNLSFNCKTKSPIIFRNVKGKLVVARESIEELYEEEVSAEAYGIAFRRAKLTSIKFKLKA